MNSETSDSDNATVSVHVDLGARSYDIAIGHGVQERVPEFVTAWIQKGMDGRTPGGKAIVISDSNVMKLHGNAIVERLVSDGWVCGQYTLPAGESSKCLAEIEKIYDQLVAMKADRHTAVLAVGGGVVGDAGGFVAATYGRGVPFIQIPTSLLAHVDSSVGGKVGINHAEGKNLIGSFYQPYGVLIDTNTIGTLPEREYRSGLAEVVKYGVILDADFFDYLEQNVEGLNSREPAAMRHIIQRSCQLKADVVEQDEFERTGLRAVLNYGHTFAHAFEALCGYGELLHGEAVSIGMVCASRLAERMGLIDDLTTDRQVRLLKAVGLPIDLPEGTSLNTDTVMDRMLLDKKVVAGQLRFVLPTRMGEVRVFGDVDSQDVRAVLDGDVRQT